MQSHDSDVQFALQHVATQAVEIPLPFRGIGRPESLLSATLNKHSPATTFEGSCSMPASGSTNTIELEVVTPPSPSIDIFATDKPYGPSIEIQQQHAPSSTLAESWSSSSHPPTHAHFVRPNEAWSENDDLAESLDWLTARRPVCSTQSGWRRYGTLEDLCAIFAVQDQTESTPIKIPAADAIFRYIQFDIADVPSDDGSAPHHPPPTARTRTTKGSDVLPLALAIEQGWVKLWEEPRSCNNTLKRPSYKSAVGRADCAMWVHFQRYRYFDR